MYIALDENNDNEIKYENIEIIYNRSSSCQ